MRNRLKLFLGIFFLGFAVVNSVIVQHPTAFADSFNTVSGTFRDRSGSPIANASFNILSPSNGQLSFTTDSNGHYSINVVPDQLRIQPSGSFSVTGVPFSVDLSGNEGRIDASTGNVTQDLQLDTVSLNVKFLDENNAPISNATVSITATNSGGTTLLVGHPEFNGFAPSSYSSGSLGLTNANGDTTASNVVRGLVYNVCALNSANGLDVCKVVQPTVDMSNIVLKVPVFNTVSGTFRDRSGSPIANASFNILSPSNGQLSFTTDTNGHYSLTVVPDVLRIQPSGSFNATGVPFSIDLSGNEGRIDASNGSINQDLQLDTVALDVSFVDQNNIPISNANVSITATNSGGTTLLVGHPEYNGFAPSSYSYGALGLTNGLGSIAASKVIRGIVYNICATNPENGLNVCKVVQPTSDTSSVTLKELVFYNVSGTFKDRVGNPISGASFNILSPSNGQLSFTTDSNGQYSLTVLPDVLRIQPSSSFSVTGVPFSVDLSANEGTINVTNANVTQDLQIDTVALKVKFVDGNNIPIANADVSIAATNSGGTTLLVGHPEFNSFAPSSYYYGTLGITNGNGSIITSTVVRGIVYNICAVDPASSVQYCSVYTPTSQGTNSLVISQPTIQPEAPTGLSTQSPTKLAPSLTWNVVNGVDHYDVYRDGSKIDSAINTTYSDINASEGSHSYYVKAVSSLGSSSDASNSVTVIYDVTAPTISYSVSQAANSAGWNNGNVTVTFVCNDNLSGIQACSSPVITSTEGVNQSVTGTTSDNAGNTASVTANLSIDKTAPTITASASIQPNGNGWNNNSVTITFNCSDSLSGIASCTSPVTVTAEGANQVVTGTAIDNAGNATTTTAIVSIDKTKPTLVATQNPAANAAGWNKSNVTVTYTCTDSLSGIASCSSPTTLSTEGNNLSATGTAVDKAGNTNSVTLTPIKIDKTAPTATGATVSNTNIFLTRPTQTYTAKVGDTLSGVVSGEFYTGTTDPGVGHGTAMTYNSTTGKITGTMSTSGLNAGSYTVNMRSKDAAGNWSAVTTKTFTIIL